MLKLGPLGPVNLFCIEIPGLMLLSIEFKFLGGYIAWPVSKDGRKIGVGRRPGPVFIALGFISLDDLPSFGAEED